MLKKKYVWLTISAALALTACAPQNAKLLAQTAQLNTAPPTTGTGGTPLIDLNSIPAATLALLMGTYESDSMRGYDESGQLVSQRYQFTMTQKTYGGKSYAYITFQSTGPLGPIGFQGYMGVSLNGLQGSYAFISAPGVVPALSPDPIAVQVILSYSNGQFSPAQSLITILDCGFSKVACSVILQSVSFANDLIKRTS